MMLVSPILPAPTFGPQHGPDDYRPAKDLDSFNSLLPPPVEFVEGSSSGAYAVPEGKYKPINVAPSPKSTKPEKAGESSNPPPPSPSKSVLASDLQTKSLYPGGIDLTWPTTCNVACGLYNTGNTCFLNSALQCLLHTPPLLRVVLAHNPETSNCRNDKGFCMICGLRQVAVKAHVSKSAFSPSVITGRLQTIAKHMRRGRQEDSHEFLRYAIDALQKSCLTGYPPKIDPKLAETTWVHKVFGGRLRSRVTCRDCGHNSDTFDRILDLSLDIFKSDTLRDAMKKFVAIDYLKGADKYKCEKCKKPVVAEKRFTIHEAPVVLTVHLKRFSPLGRKIGHHVNYDEHLSLQPFMSDGHFGPSYSLYGVICHAGGGPNSGHYYAFVKSRDGRWWEMNDESVTPIGGPPINKKTAYMLFYLRTKGQGLEAAVKSQVNGIIREPPSRPRLSESMKGAKRKERDVEMEDTEDKGQKIDQAFIGPLLPSPRIDGDSKLSAKIDPQAQTLKSKIQAVTSQKARSTMNGLSEYRSDDSEDSDDEDKGEGGSTSQGKKAKDVEPSPSKGTDMRPSSPPSVPPSSPVVEELTPNGISPASFYGPTPKKRKSPDNWTDRRQQKRPSNSIQYGNPYSAVANYSNKKKRRIPRGI